MICYVVSNLTCTSYAASLLLRHMVACREAPLPLQVLPHRALCINAFYVGGCLKPKILAYETMTETRNTGAAYSSCTLFRSGAATITELQLHSSTASRLVGNCICTPTAHEHDLHDAHACVCMIVEYCMNILALFSDTE